MRNLMTIFKKEWDRVMKDKRLIFSVMILPGLMIFIIYSFMGSAITSFIEPDEPSEIAIVNDFGTFSSIYQMYETDETAVITTIDSSEIADYQDLIDNREWDLLIVFPSDFEATVGTSQPEMSLYYNPNEMQSDATASRFMSYLETLRAGYVTETYGDISFFDAIISSTPLDEEEMIGEMMAMMLPMLVIMFLFAGAMSIGPESIAGEKERGTMATLLITPVKRSEIALGKILSLGMLALISAISSFIGILISLPKIMQMGEIDVSIYGFSDYLMILLLLFSTVFVMVGMIAIISAYSKSLKEANTLIMPIYILTILVGISSMFGSKANPMALMYLVPIYNTVQTLTAILLFDPRTWLYLLITLAANLMYVAILVFILNKMFKSERIMFAK